MLKTVAILSNDELRMTLYKRDTYDLNTVNLFYACTYTNLIIIDDKHKRYICVTQVQFKAFFRLACLVWLQQRLNSRDSRVKSMYTWGTNTPRETSTHHCVMIDVLTASQEKNCEIISGGLEID